MGRGAADDWLSLGESAFTLAGGPAGGRGLTTTGAFTALAAPMASKFSYADSIKGEA